MILCYVSDIMLLIGYIMNYVCSLLAVCIKWFMEPFSLPIFTVLQS
jgi:hypothetical protein